MITRRIAVGARLLAIVIALVGLLDPSTLRARRVPPGIAVVAASREDSAAAARMREELSGRFEVIPAYHPSVAGSVIVGRAVQWFARESDRPAVAYTAHDDSRGVSIVRIDVPRTTFLNTRVPVRVGVAGLGGAGELTLSASGVAVDRVTVAGDARGNAEGLLQYAPARSGTALLRVAAWVDGRETAVADVATLVVEQRLAVLFHDRRPSWMSTFVRRALEQDPRFAVSGRISTSRDAGVVSGRAPSSLADGPAVDLFDLLVIGAPEALTEGDVAALDRFMRRRGGSVLLLLEAEPSATLIPLTGARRWLTARLPRPARMAMDSGAPAILTSEVAWPDPFPAFARAIAMSGGL
jgi:hypothetical protein